MRFAFVGFDEYIGVFDALVAAGWEPQCIFTMPLNNRLDFNEELTERALKGRLSVSYARLTDADLQSISRMGCEVLVVAGYQWRIPAWASHLRYAVNFHPAPLPEARGPYPHYRAILQGRSRWGITCHKVSDEFDTGDILDAQTFELTQDDCHETLMARLQLAQRKLAARIAENFHASWQAATPQAGGSYWSRSDAAERTIDFSSTVADILKVSRAFGLRECMAELPGGFKVHVRRAAGWRETHSHAPGTLVCSVRHRLLIAARDGYILVQEWSPLDPYQRESLAQRG